VVVFDLDQLVRISSFGVSQWVLALEGLTADYYCFVRLRPSIVDQFNMVRAFAQCGELVSLYTPFRCPRCDEVISVRRSRLPPGAFRARITPPMIEPVARMFQQHRLEPAVRVASVSLPFHCGVCQRDLVIEMDGQETQAVASGSSGGPSCPICRSGLTPAVPAPILERERRLPFAVPPEAIARYLRAHSELGPGDDSLATAMANPRNLLVGRYQVLGVLGEGGMGEVFLVRHLGPEGFSKKLVLKRIKRSRIDDPSSADMLLDEARIAARLAHPNAVQVFGLERIGTEYFIAMEYVEGIDLARALAPDRRRGLPRQARLRRPRAPQRRAGATGRRHLRGRRHPVRAAHAPALPAGRSQGGGPAGGPPPRRPS
jgi:hypothetical protein